MVEEHNSIKPQYEAAQKKQGCSPELSVAVIGGCLKIEWHVLRRPAGHFWMPS